MQFDGEDSDVAELRALLSRALQTNRDDSSVIYRFGKVYSCDIAAENDPDYSPACHSSYVNRQFGDNTSANYCYFRSFLTRRRRRYICHSIGLIATLLLGFAMFG